MDFAQIKRTRLKSTDFSRKGEIDKPIVDIINLINSNEGYFTTSSCSGRIIVICENLREEDAPIIKKGCKWLHVSHDSVCAEDIISSLKDSQGNAVLKFEPFVLHVQCETLDKGRLMHQAAVAAGFRNSGITVGNGGKIMTAVRSTHSLEVPLTREGRLLVSEEYIGYLVELANAKMTENFRRINRFHDAFKQQLSTQSLGDDESPRNKKRDRSKAKKGHSKNNKSTQTFQAADSETGAVSIRDVIGFRIDEILSSSHEGSECRDEKKDVGGSPHLGDQSPNQGITDETLSYLDCFSVMLDICEDDK